MAWPPPFVVRISSRTKYGRLRVLPNTGLEVVLPLGRDPATAAQIVNEHKEWITRTLKRVCGKAPENPESMVVPDHILLHGGIMRVPVVAAGLCAPRQDNALMLRSRAGDMAAAAKEMQIWVKKYAARSLGEDVHALSREHGMPYSALRFRRQKSRWGSCTSRGALSLNVCLVFLPLDLARHVILHELAHTRHCNHGPGFWKTLFAMEPDALALDKRLRSAWRHVPAWMWL